MGEFVAAVLGNTEDTWSEIFQDGGQQYRAAAAAAVRRLGAGRLRLRAGGDGAVLLPDRPAHLSRHVVLPRDRDALSRLPRQGLQILAGLCDRARGRPSRAEPARHFAEGAGRAARRRQQGGGQPHPGAGRIAGRLLRRRLGESFRATQTVPRSRRHRCGAADRERDRRRHAAEAARRGASCRTPLPTARRSSASAGSPPASRKANCRPAIRSRRRSSKERIMPGIDESRQFVPLKIAVLTVSDTRELRRRQVRQRAGRAHPRRRPYARRARRSSRTR